jgi:hypothetical protein
MVLLDVRIEPSGIARVVTQERAARVRIVGANFAETRGTPVRATPELKHDDQEAPCADPSEVHARGCLATGKSVRRRSG